MFPLAHPTDSIRRLLQLMLSKDGTLAGLAIVIDQDKRVVGVVNHGDIIRAMSITSSLDDDISNIMNRDPVLINKSVRQEKIVDEVRAKLLTRTGGVKELTRYIPIVDSEGRLEDVLDLFTIITRSPRKFRRVEVYGLGFVGLTLSVALASRGHYVSGIDVNSELVSKLNNGRPHVLEPRLEDMLKQVLELDKIVFYPSPPDAEHSQVYIVAVGTPVDPDGLADLAALTTVCTTIGTRIAIGDLVMLRSTVPVGTTKTIVRKILEDASGLVAGRDFFLAFTPERTVEGMAMVELSTLPQIVGGLSQLCCDHASSFWQTLTDSVVTMESLEAAELVKLINNSYRDLSFAFANGLALLADQFNLDANKIVAAANEGYPRNNIPKPSPGVGGYCLTKDPYLYGLTGGDCAHKTLSLSGREINAKAGYYPIKLIRRFAERVERPIGDLKIFIIGVAFKGLPETNDYRGSVALDVVRHLKEFGCTVSVFDSVIAKSELTKLDLIHCDVHFGASSSDVVLIMNNHPDNAPAGLVSCLRGRQTLLFDGWSMLDRTEVEQYSEITYSSMGYMTEKQ